MVLSNVGVGRVETSGFGLRDGVCRMTEGSRKGCEGSLDNAVFRLSQHQEQVPHGCFQVHSRNIANAKERGDEGFDA